MAPTSSIRSSEEETSAVSGGTAAAAAAAAATAGSSSSSGSRDSSASPLTAEDLDSEPFYGMFDRHSDDEEEESAWSPLRLALPASPRASIPEASETFQRAMRQLDGLGDAAGRKAVCGTASEGGGSEKREHRKSGQGVRKAASFSAPDCQPSSSSSSSSSSSASCRDALAAEVRRRKSMPCMSTGKHVQWADEAGVADLVSVRLIRPRLQAKGDKEEAQPITPRSILRRLTGIH